MCQILVLPTVCLPTGCFLSVFLSNQIKLYLFSTFQTWNATHCSSQEKNTIFLHFLRTSSVPNPVPSLPLNSDIRHKTASVLMDPLVKYQIRFLCHLQLNSSSSWWLLAKITSSLKFDEFPFFYLCQSVYLMYWNSAPEQEMAILTPDYTFKYLGHFVNRQFSLSLWALGVSGLHHTWG